MKSFIKHRVVKVLIYIVLVLAIFIGIFLVSDYINFKHGNRSHLFGTLDTYSQNQTLHLYNLDLKVTSVKVVPYDEAKLVAEEQSCINKFYAKPVQNFGSGIILWNSRFPSEKPDCEGSYAPEYNASDFAQKYQQVVVGFYYLNVSNQSFDFNDSNFKLLANTGLYNEGKCPFQTEHVIKGSGLGSCVVEDISKRYSGPLNLEVKLYGKTKVIVINKY